jgi:methyl-accepting chemotaxis protein
VYDSGKTLFTRVEKAGKQLYTAYYPFKDYSGKTIGVLAIPTDISSSLAAIRNLLFMTVGLGLLALFVSGALIRIVVKQIIDQPMKKVLHFLGRRAGGDYSDRLGAGFCCEMGALAEGIDTMTDAVADAVTQAKHAEAAAA